MVRSKLSQLWNRLIEPEQVKDPLEHHRARLLNTFVVLIPPFILGIALIGMLIEVGMFDVLYPPFVGALASTVMLWISRWLSQKHSRRLGRWFLLAQSYVVVVWIASQSPPPNTAIIYLIIIPMLASLLFDFWLAGILTVVTLLVMQVFMQGHDVPVSVAADLSWTYVIICAMFFFLMGQRSLLERDRNRILAKSEAQLRSIQMQVPSCFWTLDSALMITSFTGGRANASWNPVALPAHRRLHEAALEGESSNCEIDISGVPHQASIEPLRDEAGHIVGCIGAAVDISARKRHEAEQIALAAEREQARVTARFLENAAHDLRNPLAVISTSLYLLGKIDDPEKARERRSVIADMLKRLESNLDGIFTLARLDSTPAVFDKQVLLESVAEEAVHDLSPPAKANGVTVTITRDLKTPAIEANEAELLTALTHLATNAVQHTPQGGCVTLHIYPADSQHVGIDVVDTGKGIPAEDLPYIFDRLYRGDSHRPIEGTSAGLGLALAKQVVKRHRGTITVESELGKGSRFRVRLPVSQSE